MAKHVLVADLHLTADAKDAYRWDVFPWLRDIMREVIVKK